MMKRRTWNKVVSLTMTAVFTALLSLAPLAQPVNAASKKTKYMKDARLYITSLGKSEDAVEHAEEWCNSQAENKDKDKYNDWKAVDGDLNVGAGGRSDMHVFLCYQETTDPRKAITDLAVMNESGNYDEGAYDLMLKEQRETFQDMVDDQWSMITEYRENYKNGVETAVRAHDFLNGYIEDDSKKLLGDLLLEADDATLVDVLMQSNGRVVISMQEQLALACDTGKTTWLDRLSAYGSYANLKEKYMKACNGNAKEAKKDMKADLFETAELLAGIWGTMERHYDNAKDYEKKMDLETLSEEEIQALAEDESNVAELLVYGQEAQVMEVLASYPYEGDDEAGGSGKTLLDFFRQDAEAVTGANIIYLYPLAASLTEGQIAALNETVTLFQLAQDAIQATVLNDLDTDKAKENKKAAGQGEAKKESEEALESADALMEAWQKEPISVYEGVDRGIYTGGVAVTSLAQNYGKSSGTNWTDAFIESGAFDKTIIEWTAEAFVSAATALGS